MMGENVRNWYKRTFPYDSYALIYPTLTFSDVFRMLIHKHSLDNHINCPYVKERIYQHIIEVMGIDEAFFRRLERCGAKSAHGK